MNDRDWRLGGQERYLKGATLLKRTYRPYPKNHNWDHDHCAFCWAKFMVADDPKVLHEGYCTEDEKHWVCAKCFSDFKVAFE
jgi:hypothetical protein